MTPLNSPDRQTPLEMSYPNRADLEFYEGAIVMKVARALAKDDWDTISHRRKQKFLDQALDVIQAVLADEYIRARMGALIAQRPK